MYDLKVSKVRTVDIPGRNYGRGGGRVAVILKSLRESGEGESIKVDLSGHPNPSVSAYNLRVSLSKFKERRPELFAGLPSVVMVLRGSCVFFSEESVAGDPESLAAKKFEKF